MIVPEITREADGDEPWRPSVRWEVGVQVVELDPTRSGRRRASCGLPADEEAAVLGANAERVCSASREAEVAMCLRRRR